MTLLLRHYYVINTSLLHHYYGNNGAIITVIMGLLLPIITKSIMGNNESIITHYEPTQLADGECQSETEVRKKGRKVLLHGGTVRHLCSCLSSTGSKPIVLAPSEVMNKRFFSLCLSVP